MSDNATVNRVLIIDDSRSDAYLYLLSLRIIAPECIFKHSLKSDVDFDGYDGFILDYNQPLETGIQIALRIREQNAAAKIVIITGGDTDYVVKQMPPPENVSVLGKGATIADCYKIMEALRQ